MKARKQKKEPALVYAPFHDAEPDLVVINAETQEKLWSIIGARKDVELGESVTRGVQNALSQLAPLRANWDNAPTVRQQIRYLENYRLALASVKTFAMTAPIQTQWHLSVEGFHEKDRQRLVDTLMECGLAIKRNLVRLKSRKTKGSGKGFRREDSALREVIYELCIICDLGSEVAKVKINRNARRNFVRTALLAIEEFHGDNYTLTKKLRPQLRFQRIFSREELLRAIVPKHTNRPVRMFAGLRMWDEPQLFVE